MISLAPHASRLTDIANPQLPRDELQILLQFADCLCLSTAITSRGGSFLGCNDRFAQLFPGAFRRSNKPVPEFMETLASTVRLINRRNQVAFKYLDGSYTLTINPCCFGISNPNGPAHLAVVAYKHDKSLAVAGECYGEMYDLTNRETELAIAIASGVSVSEYAETHHVSEGTVRIQLKTVFRKTGVRGQTELCALLRPSPFAAV